ncbi:MAG TPA: 1-acyl-sn-glycerol-3-phosphate acyltransferase [Terriglobales bacterium]|nr:1-acyl-sn-glycerol-3-phosphate acyltransferase [Terriglobales bacterium]
MIYSVLRWIAGIALHWFYRDIRIVRPDRIPTSGPLLIAVNHQNALVDSLIVGWLMPQRITMTAKATLADNPFISLFFRMMHVVPLRRMSDETRNSGELHFDRSRNMGAFREILSVLNQNGTVLIFPEGKSHNETGLEPLKTGLARLALQARDETVLSGLKILPVGLVFEDKGVPGTIVGVYVAEPIDLDSWPNSDRANLTAEIASRLRAVSEEAGLPPERADRTKPGNTLRERMICCAAGWGRFTHQLPIRIARSIAMKRSTSADEPAMLTIMFGIGLVLLTYAVHLTIVGAITHSLWIDGVYLGGLLGGAYWAAFQRHPRQSQSR